MKLKHLQKDLQDFKNCSLRAYDFQVALSTYDGYDPGLTLRLRSLRDLLRAEEYIASLPTPPIPWAAEREAHAEGATIQYRCRSGNGAPWSVWNDLGFPPMWYDDSDSQYRVRPNFITQCKEAYEAGQPVWYSPAPDNSGRSWGRYVIGDGNGPLFFEPRGGCLVDLNPEHFSLVDPSTVHPMIKPSAVAPGGCYGGLVTPAEAPDPFGGFKDAHAAGKIIQEAYDGGWLDLPNPKWLRPPDQYRIKPPEAPTYRPWASISEIPFGALLQCKGVAETAAVIIGYDGHHVVDGSAVQYPEEGLNTPATLLKTSVVSRDGGKTWEPAGIKIE